MFFPLIKLSNMRTFRDNAMGKSNTPTWGYFILAIMVISAQHMDADAAVVSLVLGGVGFTAFGWVVSLMMRRLKIAQPKRRRAHITSTIKYSLSYNSTGFVKDNEYHQLRTRGIYTPQRLRLYLFCAA